MAKRSTAQILLVDLKAKRAVLDAQIEVLERIENVARLARRPQQKAHPLKEEHEHDPFLPSERRSS